MASWQDIQVFFAPFDAPLDSTPSYTEITDYVERITISRGRSDELSQFTSGIAQIRLRNDARQFDPSNTSSPYYGGIIPKRQFYISSGGIALYHGFCQSFEQDWDYVNNRLYANVSCNDAFEAFASWSVAESFYTHATFSELDNIRTWYRFKDSRNLEITGKMIAGDSGPYGTNGLYRGSSSIQWGTNGLVRGGTSFKPNGNSWIDIPEPSNTSTVIGDSTTNTVEFTFFIPKLPSANMGNLMGWGTLFGVYVGGVNETAYPPGSLRFQWAFYRTNLSSNIFVVIDSSGNVADGVWHHAVCTVDLTAKQLKLYVDGILTSEVALDPANTYQMYTNTTEPFRFGRGADAGASLILEANTELGEFISYTEVKDATWVTNRYTQLSGYLGEDTGSRIQRLALLFGWPAPNLVIWPGSSLMNADAEGSVLSAMQKASEAELGMLFIGKDGKLVFYNRGFETAITTSASVQYTFGDGSGLYYESVSRVFGENIYNVGEASREGGPTFIFESAASIASYFRRSSVKSGLPYLNDNEPKALAEWLSTRLAQPIYRILDLRVNVNAPGCLPAARNIELGYRLTVTGKPKNLGSTWSVTGIVDSIKHDIDLSARTWYVNYKLAPTNFDGILTLGTVNDNIDLPLGF